MSSGSWIHDEVSRHFKACTRCRDTKPEETRVRQPEALRRSVPEATLAGMCPTGRSIYEAYLRWLAEPE